MMKKLFSFALIFTITLSGCGAVSKGPVPEQQGYKAPQQQQYGITEQ